MIPLPHKAPLDPDAPFQSRRPETHEEWQARMGAEVLAVTRSGLYLDFRFLDQALAALEPTADERCRTLATDGQILCYQPSALLRLYRENPRYLNRLYLHSVFHCLFRHLWMQGKRDLVLWHVACDIAVENVLDNLHRKSVERPLTYLRRRAYESIAAEGRVVAAAPAYRWLVTQTPGVQKQLAREFYADDHRLWPKPRTDQPNAPIPLPQKSWQKISERMQTELEMRDKEAGQGAGALAQQVKAANRSRRKNRLLRLHARPGFRKRLLYLHRPELRGRKAGAHPGGPERGRGHRPAFLRYHLRRGVGVCPSPDAALCKCL